MPEPLVVTAARTAIIDDIVKNIQKEEEEWRDIEGDSNVAYWPNWLISCKKEPPLMVFKDCSRDHPNLPVDIRETGPDGEWVNSPVTWTLSMTVAR